MAIFALLLASAGCDLAEVVTEPGEDVVVVEGVLYADVQLQQILLHRSLQGHEAAGVPGAAVTVTDEAGVGHRFHEDVPNCFQVDPVYTGADSLGFHGTCYSSSAGEDAWVHPGGTYDLRVETADGRVIQGRTHVPGDFEVRTVPPMRGPFDTPPCSLAPDSALNMLWTRSAGAAGYLSAIRVTRLREGLGDVPFFVPDPLELRGVSVSETDTTIVLPTEYGVFERFNYSDELLTAVAHGFPAGTIMLATVSAADRNWVTSARGGSFNPSGQVRISTVVGGGVGVFASLVQKRAFITVQRSTSTPRCGLRG
ncbi:DUF4249 family protein [Longimicrobium sp.]|uniref:DUF4249 family protein n=1 Tax=Longimicrobium sp. TaxID=2029185 RepID=UPI002B6EFA2D|nr:DUF4249 family protein [Longimicrobium sp.]HSU16806.1 DUF4249 family protein [Longimicrobium sp.]